MGIVGAILSILLLAGAFGASVLGITFVVSKDIKISTIAALSVAVFSVIAGLFWFWSTCV